ncbi:hypothetical protein PMIT1320_02048 [Prochlorococcus marinus str. MIT 1320]|nr:hypothetical protein PMIT1320_02048 [Prochlorococcus marinus str. MIT 1320]
MHQFVFKEIMSQMSQSRLIIKNPFISIMSQANVQFTNETHSSELSINDLEEVTGGLAPVLVFLAVKGLGAGIGLGVTGVVSAFAPSHGTANSSAYGKPAGKGSNGEMEPPECTEKPVKRRRFYACMR